MPSVWSFQVQSYLDHLAHELDDRSPSAKRFAESVTVRTPARLVTVVADSGDATELSDAYLPGNVWETVPRAIPSSVHSLLMARRSLRHPSAEDGLQRMRRLVHPIVVDLDLRQACQDERGSRQRLRTPRQSFQRPQQSGTARTCPNTLASAGRRRPRTAGVRSSGHVRGSTGTHRGLLPHRSEDRGRSPQGCAS